MKINTVGFDERHFASSLTQSERILRWDAQGHTHCIIVRTDFGNRVDLSRSIIEEMERIPKRDFFSGQEIELSNHYVITVITKGYVNNFAVTVLPATYAVFCCSYDSNQDECIVYLPNDACNYQCVVKMKVDVRVSRIAPESNSFFGRLFGSHQLPYYSVEVPRINGYRNGSLRYTFEGLQCAYPITESMLGNKFFVLPYNNEAPKIINDGGDGYEIRILN